MADDIERFVAMVKAEADKEEDFVEERVKKTTLYKLLEARYDNVDELLRLALEKSNWLARLRSAMEYERKRSINERVYNEPKEKQSERLLYYLSIGSNYKEIYERCMFRYGRPKLMEIAREIVEKYPSDTTTIGKYPGLGRLWSG